MNCIRCMFGAVSITHCSRCSHPWCHQWFRLAASAGKNPAGWTVVSRCLSAAALEQTNTQPRPQPTFLSESTPTHCNFFHHFNRSYLSKKKYFKIRSWLLIQWWQWMYLWMAVLIKLIIFTLCDLINQFQYGHLAIKKTSCSHNNVFWWSGDLYKQVQ